MFLDLFKEVIFLAKKVHKYRAYLGGILAWDDASGYPLTKTLRHCFRGVWRRLCWEPDPRFWVFRLFVEGALTVTGNDGVTVRELHTFVTASGEPDAAAEVEAYWALLDGGLPTPLELFFGAANPIRVKRIKDRAHRRTPSRVAPPKGEHSAPGGVKTGYVTGPYPVTVVRPGGVKIPGTMRVSLDGSYAVWDTERYGVAALMFDAAAIRDLRVVDLATTHAERVVHRGSNLTVLEEI